MSATVKRIDPLLLSDQNAMVVLGGIGRTTYITEIAPQLERIFIGRRPFVTVESVQRYVRRLAEKTEQAPAE